MNALFLTVLLAGLPCLLATPDTSTTNGTIYDISSQICCNGNVVALTSFWSKSCCGKNTFDTRKSICCNNIVIDKPNREVPIHCCGNNAYSSENEYCCGETVLPLSGNLMCCESTQPFDPTKQTCCRRTRKVIDGASATCPQNDMCGDEELQDRQVCCFGYDLENKREIKQAHNVTGIITSCCGYDQLYDPSNQMCCYATGVVLPQQPYKECCGREAYDVREANNLCCHGLKLYDPDAEMCCGSGPSSGYVLEKANRSDNSCCGDATYNSITHVCCNGKVSKKENCTDACCW